VWYSSNPAVPLRGGIIGAFDRQAGAKPNAAGHVLGRCQHKNSHSEALVPPPPLFFFFFGGILGFFVCFVFCTKGFFFLVFVVLFGFLVFFVCFCVFCWWLVNVYCGCFCFFF